MKFVKRFLTILIGFGLTASQVSCQTEEEKAVESVAVEFVEALLKGDFNKIVELTHSDFKETMENVGYLLIDEETKAEVLEEWKKEFSDLTVESVDVDGDEAQVVFKENDGEYTSIDLKKDDGKWKIFLKGDVTEWQEMANMGALMRALNDYGEDDEFFNCNDGSEIPLSFLNDGECDCDDCEDED
jgi:hypothetical protein